MAKLIAIVLIVSSASIFAQDEVARNALERLSASNKSYKNITIDFDFFLENKVQKIKKHQAGILVLEGEKFKLKMNNQTIINNGESQWIYLADMNEVQIMAHDPEENIMSPRKLFTIYEENYKYTYVGSDSEKGKRLQIINLFPKESREFIKINIAIDESKNQLKRIIIYDKNGGTYTYLVKSFKSNTSIDPFIFNIEDFPDVEVIDLR